MIAIAAVALLMAFLRLPDEVRAGVELMLSLAVFIGVFAELVAFSGVFVAGHKAA